MSRCSGCGRLIQRIATEGGASVPVEFGPPIRFVADNNSKEKFINTLGGRRTTAPAGSDDIGFVFNMDQMLYKEVLLAKSFPVLREKALS